MLASSQEWKKYPYQPAGGLLSFPGDEGFHPAEEIEWWYINGHVTGQTTGDYYTFMISYFYEPVFIFDGFRIFDLSNENSKEFYDETLPCIYESLAEDSLNIIATTGYPSTHYEEWVTLTVSSVTLKHFRYIISATAEHGSIDINCNTVKRPLIIADSGFLYQGDGGYSYYYSQTMIEISGLLTFNSTTEEISGTGWLDRQFGTFNPNDNEDYEWFCVQLDNGMDLNIWNIFTDDNRIPATPAYRICSIYSNDSSALTTSEFDMERLAFDYSQDSARCYSQQWHLTIDTFDIDLIISSQNPEQEVELPFRFFEGSTSVQGTVQEIPTAGKGFTELVHSYGKPDIDIAYPGSNDTWDGPENIRWRLNNPDQGNSLIYDVDISTDNRSTFRKIAMAISDTDFYWNPAYFIDDTAVWLRITGYSADSTLTANAQNITGIQTAQKNYQLCPGDNISFLILLSEKEEYSYQWQKNEEDIYGETDNIYFLNSLTSDNNGDYRCIITGNAGTDTTISYSVEIKPVFEEDVYESVCSSDSIFIGGAWHKTEGIYYDTLKSVFGCDSIRVVYLSLEQCGLDIDNEPESDFTILANTVNETIHIMFNEYYKGIVEILNPGGEILKVRQLKNEKEVIMDVSDLAGGLYILRIRNGRFCVAKKIILYNY